ncbi:MAG: DUF2080 family transposase-associated protein [Nanoarchaeota archaeon]|nr:DUF2080 family transposase-associated protein [Nanoarchaeota archaeon]
MEQEQIIRKVTEIGNGAHIFAPKEWMNEKVLIIRIEKKSIKEEIMEILYPHLNKIIAVFIYGSHARAEASETSDIDVLIISKEKFKIEKKRNFEFLVIPEHSIESAIKTNPILMYSIFKEAKAIINEDYLDKYKNKKIALKDFSSFIESTKKISVKSSEDLLELDRKTGKTVSTSVLYSAILRLRGVFIINCLLKNKLYSNSSFRTWIKKNIEIDYEKVYEVYRYVRDNKNIKNEIPIETGEKLINFLKKEIDKLSKE